jgi:hypothetical protein
MALRAKAVIMPEAADMVLALDIKVISKAYMEQGRPGEQGAAHAVAKVPMCPCTAHHAFQMSF